uniref:Uncharacterized protein n=1 Tax=Acrobeloides nanus TaxID=290746 RepID=A0A914DND2_9BILA
MIASIAFGLTHVVELIEWIFEFSALHSCLNTMVMIVSISSYRKAIWDMFKFKKETEVASVTNVINVKQLRKQSIFILIRQKAITKPK